MSLDAVISADLVKTRAEIAALNSAVVAARSEIASLNVQVNSNSVIKSVQRGVIEISSSIVENIATITAVNPAKASLQLLGCRGYMYGAGGSSHGMIQLLSPTQVRAWWTSTSVGESIKISWELVEFK